MTADWVTGKGVAEGAAAPQPSPMCSPAPTAPMAQDRVLVSQLGGQGVTLRQTQLPLAGEICPGSAFLTHPSPLPFSGSARPQA